MTLSIIKRLKFSVILGLILFVFLGYFSVAAQETTEQQGLSISPVTFELNADPQDVITNQIKIFNPTEFPQNVKMKVEDFSPVGEEGQVILEEPEDNSTYSLASWTFIDPAQFTLQPKQQQIVQFIISVPKDGEPGGHYGSIVAMVSGGTADQTGATITSKRGCLLLLRVSGNIKEDILVDTFETKSFQEYGPVSFDLKFKNEGNVHVKPAGFITITDTFGNQVAEIEIPQNNVIPDAIRQAGTTWEVKNLAGRYTATVVASFGNSEKQTVTAVTTFTVFPWKKALIIGSFAVIIGVLLYSRRRRIKRSLKVLLGKDK